MPQYDNCSNCFMPIAGKTVCPNCGHDVSKERQYPGVLPAFTTLNNRYLVGRVLGKGGFGVTYIAKDLYSNRICAIKEYMPAEYSTRSGGTLNIVPFADDKARYVFNHGRDKFMLEAKTLYKLRSDPIVVDIWDYFTQNNTAYLVMEFLDGQDLRKMARASGGKLDPDFAKMIFVTVASSLVEIHKKNILHRDLSPENIIYTRSGEVKLIDFGAARNFVSTQNKGMSILLKPGFAPPEQYNAKGGQGPWSDVYALCATFYTLVSGKPLVDALFRYRGEQQPSLYALGCPVTKKTSDVIERGMELDQKRRYKDFMSLLNDIDISVTHSASKFGASFGNQTGDSPGGPTASSVSRSNQVKTGGPTASPTGGQPGGPHGVKTTPPPPPSPIQPYIGAVVGNGIYNKVYIGTSDIFKIGRSAQSCQYVIAGDTNISRIHCYIRFTGNKIYLIDSSSNGTFMENGMRLQKNKAYAIEPGTKFYVATRNHMLILNV